MTKEELEKEAEEYVSKYQGWGWTPHRGSAVYYAMLNSYIDSAEPREKRIAELTEQNTSLLTSVENLNKSVQELEAQIEKMKLQYDYAFNQLCKSREILCSMLSEYRDRKEIDYSTRKCGEKLLKEGVYKND